MRETYVYAIKDGDTLRLDKYTDTTFKTKEPRDVMIYVHGGGFSTDSRKNAAQEVFVRHLATQGIVAFQIDYRLGAAPHNKWGFTNVNDAVRLSTEDLVSATRFILDHQKEWNINPRRVMISGGSAGAIYVLTAEYDLCNDEPYTRILPEDFNWAGVISHAGAIPANDTLVWKRKPCPLMLMHGTKDNIVPIEKKYVEGKNYYGSIYIASQLEKMKAPHWLYLVIGADHIVAMKPLVDNHEDMDRFIRKFVNEQIDASAFTEWADKVPDSMTTVDDMIKAVPLYIYGYGKYLDEMDSEKIEKPKTIVY